MSNIGLIDVDSHNFPNLALMKLSAYHKAHGDHVEWWNGFEHYDRVYQSKVFDETYTEDMEFCVMADEIIKGGTGYDLENKLPEEIEHSCPDYSLYGITDTAYGFLTRGCPRACPFCIVSAKEGRSSRTVADLDEFYRGQKNIELLDPNLLASKDHEYLLKQLGKSKAWVNFNQGLDARLLTEENINLINEVKVKNIHFAWDFLGNESQIRGGLEQYRKFAKRKQSGHGYATVYVLTNFDTTHEEDLYRVEVLRGMEFEPYIMIYDRDKAPKITRHLQRYVNNRYIFYSTTWEEYLKTRSVIE